MPDQEPDEILELLKGHLEREGFGDVEVTVIGTAESAGTAIDHPFVQRVARVAEETGGERPSIIPRIGGTLPIVASLNRHLAVPGVAAPDNVFSFSSRAHAPNEHIDVDSVEHAARFTYALLKDLGGDR